MDLAIGYRSPVELLKFLHSSGLGFRQAHLAHLFGGDENWSLTVLGLMLDDGIAVDEQSIASAASYGWLKMLKLLLDRTNLDAKPDKGQILYKALQSVWGHADAAELLIRRGAPVNDPSRESGSVPMLHAAEYGHTKTVEVLLAHGADVTGTSNNPLTLAAERGHLEVVKLLLLCKQIPQKARAAAMSAAVDSGHDDIVRAILQAGLDPEEPLPAGGTALWYAVSEGQLNCAQVLVAAGAKKDMHIVAGLGDLPALKEMIGKDASAGAEPDRYGRQPIHWAAKNGQLAAVQWLLAKGASINAADMYGGTPLSYAIGDDHLRLAKWLIEHGADVNASGANRRMPLHTAASRGWVPIARLLLDKGAKINAQDEDGKTPLHLAASRAVAVEQWDKKDDMCRLLISRGAAKSIKDKQRRPPGPNWPQP
jgi:ankyrin repeat protein